VTIPFAMVVAFILMFFTNVSANLLSLGAIDFGIIVDGAIVMTEAILRRREAKPNEALTEADVRETVRQVARPVFFATAIIITTYLPLFAFQRIEAKLFYPMAYAVGYAQLGALAFALLVVPGLAYVGVSAAAADRPQCRSGLDRGGAAQHFDRTLDLPGQWWTLFHSKDLNILVQRALAANPDLQAAQAALTVAKQNVYAQEGLLFPAINGNVFGGTRRSIEALTAQADAVALQKAVASEQATSKSLDITRKRMQLGDINYLALLNAQQSYQQALISLVQAKAARYADTVALFQALGGGWWNRSDVEPERPLTVSDVFH
jgi:hypothetical protein